MEQYLRPYQREVVDRYFEDIAAGITRSAIVMPAGAGKIAILAEILRRAQPESVLVTTPHFSVFQNRVWTLSEELQKAIADRCHVYEHDSLEDAGPLYECRNEWREDGYANVWYRRYDMVVVDGFSRSSATAWKDTLRMLLAGLEEEDDIPMLGLSTMTNRFTYDDWDVGEEVFHGNYLVRMSLAEAWTREGVPVGRPTFITTGDPWVHDLLAMREQIVRETRGLLTDMDREELRWHISDALIDAERPLLAEHLPKLDGRYLVFHQYVDEVPILEEWLSFCLGDMVKGIHFYSVNYTSEDPSGEMERFVYDDSSAIKFMTAINMVGDDDSVPCDGVLIARSTRSVNVYMRLLSQASQAGTGAVVLDLQDTITKAKEWDSDIPEDSRLRRELKMLRLTMAPYFERRTIR